MERVRIIASDLQFYRQVNSNQPWILQSDGRIALCDTEGSNMVGWENIVGTVSLHLPHGAKITGMTIRGRVATYGALFFVQIVQIPNGSHPNSYFLPEWCKDSMIKWLWLSVSVNNGYIHHEASRDDIDHEIDLVNNSYMLRVEAWTNWQIIFHPFTDQYLTDIEVRYKMPLFRILPSRYITTHLEKKMVEGSIVKEITNQGKIIKPTNE